MSMLNWVSAVSLGFAVVSFVAFIWLLWKSRKQSPPTRGGAGNIELQSAIADTAKLIEALAKLADSLQKAGPVVISLIATIFFLVVAALSAGLGK